MHNARKKVATHFGELLLFVWDQARISGPAAGGKQCVWNRALGWGGQELAYIPGECVNQKRNEG